ncbi:MAG: transglutaminase domain-containing protein [Cytophagia bacterium]|nr:transglutaminase domain-containing protein [Cytophagia bacterium]
MYYFIIFFFINFVCLSQIQSEILLHDEKVEIIKGKVVSSKHLKIFIGSYEDRIETFSIPFTSKNQPKIISASIQNVTENKYTKLKKKDFTETNYIDGSTFMSDQKQINIKLPTNGFPYIFEVNYTTEVSDYILISHWSPVYYYKMPVKQASLEVILPHDFNVQIDYDKILNYELTKSQSQITHHWSISNIEPVKPEAFSPPLDEMIPLVRVIPGKFHYGIDGSAKDWSKFGSWLYNLNEDLERLTPSEKLKVDELTKGLNSPEDIIRALYYHLQDNTRYINVSFGIGGLKPYPAEYVCQNQFGDCKALTIYMKALLKYKGINSFYTPIYGGEKPEKVDPNVVTSQFNHVILTVPLDRDTLWLENTSSFLPMGYSGSFTQGRKALLVDEHKSRLIDIPDIKTNEVLTEAHYQLELDGSNKAEVLFENIFRGKEFENLSYFQKERRSSFDRYLLDKLPFLNSELISKEIKTDRSLPYIGVTGKIRANSIARSLGNEIMVAIPPIPLPPIEGLNKRTTSVRIDYPIAVNNSFELIIDPKYNLQAEVSNEVKSKFGSYSVNTEVNSDRLKVEVKLRLNKAEVPLAEYKEFFDFYEALKLAQSKTLIALSKQK